MTKTENKSTDYFSGKGKYQRTYNKLFEMHVPGKGEAETEHGEAFRCYFRIIHDVYNNGGCNLTGRNNKGMNDYYDGMLQKMCKYLYYEEDYKKAYNRHKTDLLRFAKKGDFEGGIWENLEWDLEVTGNALVSRVANDSNVKLEKSR